MTDISHTRLLAYQPAWKEKFQVEKEKLQKVFGDEAITIEHIGSTSIEGLSSKSIIDIAVLIDNYQNADKFIEPLSKLSYWYDKDKSSSERHFFRKGNPTEFHLSIAYTDRGGFFDRQIVFRDYLRNHPNVRDEYVKLKEELLKTDPTGKDKYISGKSEFIQKILDLAKVNK